MSDAKEAKKPEGEAPAKASAAGGGGNKILTILVGVNSLLLVGVMAFLVMQMRQQAAQPAAAAPAAHEKAEEGEEKKEPSHGEEKKEGGHGEEAKEGGHGAAGNDVSPRIGPLVRIADFVIHLRNPDADRYARMSFDVEVFGDADKERLTAQLPRVRDAFIAYLSDRTLEDLRGSEGLGRTKENLQTMLRQTVPDTRIRTLYISDFVIQ